MAAPVTVAGTGPPAPPVSPPPAVAARAIGVAMIASICSSVMSQANGLAANDLAGLLSVSADDASWIATATTMAEVAVIPVAAILTAVLTLRRIALSASLFYGVAAALSLSASDLPAFVAARVLVGAAGGLMPVMMMVTVMATLPPGPRRAIGLAVFAFASSIPAALAPSVGGLLLDLAGPRALALAELGWVAAFALVAATSLPKAPMRLEILSGVDWRSYGPLVVALAATVLVLSQGERRFWFESPLIATGTAVALSAAIVSLLSLTTKARPLIHLDLLARASFGWAFVVAIVFRFGLLVAGFVMPQVLGRLQGFRLPEIGEATLWIALAHIAFFPLAWWTTSRFDARLSLALGLSLFTASALMNVAMTLDWQAAQFIPALLVLGAGQAFFLVATLTFATAGVPPELGATAASLFNIARVLGQSLGTAVMATLITEREKLHSARIVERLTDATPWFAERLDAATRVFRSLHGDEQLAQMQGSRTVAGAVANQAFVLAYSDAFLVIAAILFAASIFVLMLPALPQDRPHIPAGPPP
jgi:DHA2 family multidrug resistance protein